MAGIVGAANPLLSIVGFGVGSAIGPILRPPIQDLLNESWQAHPVRPLDAQTAAALWVEGRWTGDEARAEGERTGFDNARMAALHDLIDNPPDVATLMELWRRNLISPDKFIEGLRHLRVEPDYFEAIRQTHNRLLSPDNLAALRQRGFMSRQDQYDEAALQGVTNARAEHQFELSGLPPGPERALAMWRRDILSEAEFRQAIVEGNEKLKYVDKEAALLHPLLTPAQIVNQRLRGWRDTPWMNARGAEHGFSVEQMNDLFQGQGRPISTRQVFIGQRRGGVYGGPTGDIDSAILKQLQESNIRPEWYDLADAQKESYPSAFVIRQLATSAALSPTQTHRILMEIGWPEWLIDAVVEAWAGTTGPTTGPRVKSAVTSAVGEIRSAYILERADQSACRGWLERLNVEAGEIDGLFPVWDVMREVPQRGLTLTQIRKAYKKVLMTREQALDELEDLGLTPADAAIALDQ